MAPFHPRLKSLGFPGCRLVIFEKNKLKYDKRYFNNLLSKTVESAHKNANVDFLDKLLSYGIELDVNTKVPDDFAGSSVLHIACMFNKINMIKWLIKHGADVNILDFNNNSPIMYVLYFNNISTDTYNIFSILLNASADPNSVINIICEKYYKYKYNDIYSKTFEYEMAPIYKEILKLFIKHNATIDKKYIKDIYIKYYLQKRKIKELEDKIIDLTYRPGGSGYLDAKADFERRASSIQ